MGSHQTCHRLTAQSALRVDCMNAEQTGERTGSRPKPPKAGARSASLEPGRSPVYLPSTQLLRPLRGHLPTQCVGRNDEIAPLEWRAPSEYGHERHLWEEAPMLIARIALV